MKIKYKLTLIFILIITAASLPLSLFILDKQEKEKITNLTNTGRLFAMITAETAHNMLIMNGGDIEAAKIDLKEMSLILQSMKNEGLIHADAILISSRKDINGTVIAGFHNLSARQNPFHNVNKISSEEVDRLKKQNGFREIAIPGIKDVCYEFSSLNSISGKNPLCIGRLFFSKSIIIAPIKQLYQLIYGATIGAILLAGLLGLIFSRFITKPITTLALAARKIEEGDLDHRIPVKSRDELGYLSNTYNHMLQIIKLKIEELENTNKRLTELDILKDDFLANISHEIRTPLQGIIGITESLIKGATGQLRKDTKHDLSLIIASGKRLSNLVDDILDFSKLKHHDIILKKEPVNMHDVAQLVISIIRPFIHKKSLTIANLIPLETAYVYGDESRLLQIMLNLVSNAIKFTEHGEIKIISAENPDDVNYISFSVIDTGIGIRPEDMERIFESFEQADGSATRNYGGTGLGLAITKKLVELHDGKIKAESGPGRGSNFTITLQKCPELELKKKKEARTEKKELFDISASDIRKPHPKNKKSHGEKEKTILVVDDDPINIQVLINHLSLEGYIVVEAANSVDVFKILEGFLPDLIILDIMLPGMSGYDISRKIREKYSSYMLPIVMLTAKNKPDDIVTGLNSGANDYLTKPINRDELIARVQNLISMKDSVLLQNELNVIKHELDMAIGIQKAILPEEPPRMKNINFAVRYESTKKIGGDLYNYHAIDDYKIGIFIADVSGHGVPAAIISAMLEVVLSFFKQDYNNPGLLFNKINDKMVNYSHGFYLTACYVYIDLEKMKLYHSNAGHRPLLIWRKSEKNLLQDKIFDPPIGMFPNKIFSVNEIDIKDNDRIILYTDGIIEEKNSDKKIFGDRRFNDLIKDSDLLTADEFADHALKTVKEWSDVKPGKQLGDDVTLIVMDVKLTG